MYSRLFVPSNILFKPVGLHIFKPGNRKLTDWKIPKFAVFLKIRRDKKW